MFGYNEKHISEKHDRFIRGKPKQFLVLHIVLIPASSDWEQPFPKVWLVTGCVRKGECLRPHDFSENFYQT